MLRREALENSAAVLIVTHDPSLLGAADRVINMSYGRIILDVRHRELTKRVAAYRHSIRHTS
jgi:ABC-type transport system involved in cytochrome bd biosynthesis fused ATPase/permease subunit